MNVSQSNQVNNPHDGKMVFIDKAKSELINEVMIKLCHQSLFMPSYSKAVKSKREVPRDVRNSKVLRQDKFRRDWSRHLNTCKSQSGTGPGIRRSKRPLLACRTRCICSMETLHNKV